MRRAATILAASIALATAACQEPALAAEKVVEAPAAKRVAKEGKIPVHASWRDRVRNGTCAWDGILTAAALASFALDQQALRAAMLLRRLAPKVGDALATARIARSSCHAPIPAFATTIAAMTADSIGKPSAPSVNQASAEMQIATSRRMTSGSANWRTIRRQRGTGGAASISFGVRNPLGTRS